MGSSVVGGTVRLLAALLGWAMASPPLQGTTIQVSATPAEHAVVLGGGEYATGTQARLMVGPEVGYRFDHWEGDVPVGQEKTNPLTFEVTSDGALRAVVVLSEDPKEGWFRGGTVVSWGSNGGLKPPVGLSNVVEVATGEGSGLALKSDGKTEQWGWTYGTPPEGQSNLSAVAAGSSHMLALSANGRVVGWGEDDRGQATPPSGLGDVVAIAAGDVHSLALQRGGTVVGWGDRLGGQAKPPRDLSNVVAVAAGYAHSLALRADGSVVGWGWNESGKATPPAELNNVVAIAAGYAHSLALKADGTVVGWGSDGDGRGTPPQGLKNVVGITAGYSHSLALRADGTVVGWGGNWFGQAEPPSGLSNVVSIAAGNVSSLAVTAGDWGLKSAVPRGLVQRQSAPFRLASGFAGASSCPRSYQWYRDGIALAGATNGTLTVDSFAFEDMGSYRLLAADSTRAVLTPPTDVYAYLCEVAGEGRIETLVDQAAGRVFVYAVPTAGWKLDHWEGGLSGTELQKSFVLSQENPSVVARAVFAPAMKITVSASVSGGLVIGSGAYDERREVRVLAAPDMGYRFSHWEGDVPPGMESTNPLLFEPASNCTLRAIMVVSDDPREGWFKGGTVVGWGANAYGQVDPPLGLSNVVEISAGGYHGLALTAEGTVAGWGGTAELKPPSGLSNVISIAAGYGHSLAVRRDGTVLGWGQNRGGFMSFYIGQAVPPEGLSNVVAVAAGDLHSLALKTDGTVVAWGIHGNVFGEFFWPVTPPAGLSHVAAINAGGSLSRALLDDGTAVEWGSGWSGLTDSLVESSNIVAIVPGAILKADGLIVGLGQAVSFLYPLTNIVSISAGCCHGLALTEDGMVGGWVPGVIGANQATVPPPGLSNVVAIAAGSGFSLAITANTWGLRSPASAAMIKGQGDLLELTPKFAGFGDGGRTYQWCRNGTPINGAAARTFHAPVLGSEDSGSYRLIAYDSTKVVLTPATQVFVYQTERVGEGMVKVSVEEVSGTVSFRGVAAPGWRLDHWEGGVSGTEMCKTFSFSKENPSVLARVVFAPAAKAFQVSASVSGHGVVMGVGVIDEGREARLMAAPEVGHRFDHWEGEVIPGQEKLNPLVFPVESDIQVRAVVIPDENLGTGWFQGGRVGVWGSSLAGPYGCYRRCAPPEGLSNAVALAAGDKHGLALRLDGTVASWGDNSYGQVSDPGSGAPVSDLSNIVAVAAGRLQSFALSREGTVTGWGASRFPIKDGGWSSTGPKGLIDITAIAAGGYHCLAVKKDGTILVWADDSRSQVSLAAGVSNVCAVAAGRFHSLALKQDGTVAGWGIQDRGLATPPPSLKNVISVAAGGDHSLALTADGTVVGWGDNSWGQASPPDGLTDVVAIAAGNTHSIALQDDGRLVVWGTNAAGWLKPLPGIVDVVTVGAGVNYSMALSADTWGLESVPSSPVICDGMAPPWMAPRFVGIGAKTRRYQWFCDGKMLDGATNRALNRNLSLPIRPGTYQLAAAVATNAILTPGIDVFTYECEVVGQGAIQVSANPSSLSAQFEAVAAPGWKLDHWEGGLNGSELRKVFAFSSIEPTVLARAIFVPASLVKVSVSALGNGVVLGSGVFDERAIVRLTAAPQVGYRFDHWEGDVPEGQEGVNPLTYEVSSNRVVRAVILPSENPQEGRFRGGKVIGWGSDWRGETTIPPGLDQVVSISAGRAHGLALKADGTVVAWGDNAAGQASSPQGLTNVIAIDAGYAHNLALKADGTVVAWGKHVDSLDQCAELAAPPKNLSNVVAVAAGRSHSLALTASGTVVGWGSDLNWYGQWGGQATPPKLSNIVAIAAGESHSLALTASGTVVGWGDNYYGQATPPANLTNVVAIAAGAFHGVALRADRTTVGWGSLIPGQSTSPPGVSNVVAVDGGGFHSLMLTADGSAVVLGRDYEGPVSPRPACKNVIAVAAGLSFSLALIAEELELLSGSPEFVVSEMLKPVTLTNVMAGGPALQWKLNGSSIEGANQSTLSFDAVEFSDAGSYQLLATGNADALLSPMTELVVYQREVVGQGTIQVSVSESTKTVAFEAVAGEGWRLHHWEGGLSGSELRKTFAFNVARPTVLARAVFVPGTTPSVPTLSVVLAGSEDSMTLRWPLNPDQAFQLEYKNDLNEGTWIPVITGVTTNLDTASFIGIRNEAQRFYRLRSTAE